MSLVISSSVALREIGGDDICECNIDVFSMISKTGITVIGIVNLNFGCTLVEVDGSEIVFISTKHVFDVNLRFEVQILEHHGSGFVMTLAHVVDYAHIILYTIVDCLRITVVIPVTWLTVDLVYVVYIFGYVVDR